MRESYFNVYRSKLEGFFKGRDGTITAYEENRPESVYCEPFYSEDECDKITEQARRFFFTSNTDHKKVRGILQGFNRRLEPVRIFKNIDQNFLKICL